MTAEANYWHGCPMCAESDGPSRVLNVGATHWAICETHRWKWRLGANLFSGWRNEHESLWQANAQRLEQFANAKFYTSQPVGSRFGEQNAN